MRVESSLRSHMYGYSGKPRASASSASEAAAVNVALTPGAQRLLGSTNGMATYICPKRGEEGGDGLNSAEEAEVKDLERRDAEVRTHERQHVVAAGPYARGPAQFSYQVGPDGKLYAVGGSVEVDTGPVKGDPEATLRKARALQASATAPSELSAADVGVAAGAVSMALSARADLAAAYSPGSAAAPGGLVQRYA